MQPIHIIIDKADHKRINANEPAVLGKNLANVHSERKDDHARTDSY